MKSPLLKGLFKTNTVQIKAVADDLNVKFKILI